MTSRLNPVRIQKPGRNGITDGFLTPESPEWLSAANNLIFGLESLEGRKSIDKVTIGNPHTDNTEGLAEYFGSTKEIVSSANLKIWTGTTTLTDVTGTITTPTGDNWQFVNFNGKMVGVQQSHTPIVYSGATFANITAGSGSLPTGNCALAAFGRLWAADSDGTTLKFSGVLDETDWGGAGAGSLDTLQAWPDGSDTITALAELQNRLLIFGERSILVYANPEDPTATTFALEDIVKVGTPFRDSLVPFADDVYFMSVDGLRSARRAIQFSNLPQADLSIHVRQSLRSLLNTVTACRGAYSTELGAILYAVTFSGTFSMWLFDLREPLPNGALRYLQWTPGDNDPTSVLQGSDGTFHIGVEGGLAEYANYTGTGDTSRTISYTTVPSSLGVDRVKSYKSATIEYTTLAAQSGATFVPAIDNSTVVASQSFSLPIVPNQKQVVTIPIFGNGVDTSWALSVPSVDDRVVLGAVTMHFKAARTINYG